MPGGAQHLGEPDRLRAADEHGAGAVGAGAQLLHRALADQPAGADDDHPVDGLLDLGQQVAGDQHRAPLLVGQVPEEAAQPLDALGVQAVGRLVQHEHGGVAEQRGRQGQPLPHAEGVAAGAPVAGVGQTRPGRAPRRRGTAGARRRGSRPAGGCGPTAPGGRRLEDRADGAHRLGQRGVGRAVEGRRPASGRSSPRTMRRVVVFPAPLGPRKPVTEPGSTVKLRSETAWTGPNDLESPLTSSRTGRAGPGRCWRWEWELLVVASGGPPHPSAPGRAPGSPATLARRVRLSRRHARGAARGPGRR